jgi:uncharacterized protein HemY
LSKLKQLEDLVKQNPNNALMHYTLGIEYLGTNEGKKAIAVLKEAINLEPDYSAAYRELGKAFMNSNLKKEAVEIFNKGIAVAEEKGDIQTAKEMHVFLKRISK